MPATGDLMLILAYMLKLNPDWEHARIHIRAMVQNKEEKQFLWAGIEHSLAKEHIPASIHISVKSDQSFTSVLQEESKGADIVFLGLKVSEAGEEDSDAGKIDELAQVGKVTVFVQNNSLKDTFPVLLQSQEE